jgi:hypothetical protein
MPVVVIGKDDRLRVAGTLSPWFVRRDRLSLVQHITKYYFEVLYYRSTEVLL